VTDYIWFAFFMHTPQAAVWAIVTPIMVKLTVESVIAAFLALVVVRYVRRSGISF